VDSLRVLKIIRIKYKNHYNTQNTSIVEERGELPYKILLVTISSIRLLISPPPKGDNILIR